MLKRLALQAIRFYQRYLSVDNSEWAKKLLKHKHPIVCKFQPTCSEYTYQAIKKYGIVKGGFLGAWRIFRCNPFTKGGHDPVK